MEMQVSSALFWDYENVPLRNKDWGEFMFALDYIRDRLNFHFTRIYARKQTLKESNRKILRFHKFKSANFKWVKSNGKNAVDKSMMSSCIGVLRSQPQISQILLITGDGDFKKLVASLPNHHISVICQKYNYNQHLIDTADEAMSVSSFIKKPGALIDI